VKQYETENEENLHLKQKAIAEGERARGEAT